MKVLIITDGSGPKYHRLLLPLALMPGVEVINTPVLTDKLCEGVDIVFCNRLLYYQGEDKSINLRQKHGFKVVIDFDDHWELDPDHISYKQYQQHNASEFMKFWLVEADAVTVTHERLALEAMQFNNNVHVLPNAIPYFGQFTTPKVESDLTRLFWAGSNTHEHDIALLKEPVRQLKGLPIKMVMGGFSKNKIWYRMRNNYTNYGKLPNELLEGLPVNEYYYLYSRCDISLIPLKEGRFNSHKSNLKVLEAANIKANVIVSNVHPYKDLPYVNYVNDPGDWAKHVKWILGNRDEAAQQAKDLHQYCNERFNFERINKTRYEIFKSLCSPKTEPALSDSGTSTTHG